PRWLARTGPLPQDEIAGVLLRVGVGVDAGAGLHAFEAQVREPPVSREARNAEVDGAVAPVRMALPIERRNEVGHRAQVRLVGGTRRFLDLLEAECPGILPKRRDVLVRV